jgi:predicted ATPase/class 3 adenylate cyclase/Tfp pilus assembly protein PilF
MSEPTASPLTICLLGPFEVRVNGLPLPRLRSRKSHWLLALLTLRAGGKVERAWLAGTLWPDSSESQALHSLRVCLADLRQALGPEAGRLYAPTLHSLSLELAGAEADVRTFDQAIAQGGPEALERAVALYRGPLLEGCAEAWAFQERQHREQAWLQALEALATHRLTSGDAGAAEGYLRRAVAADPLRESAQRALMQTLAAAGNDAAALLTYRELRVLLHRELNAEPAPETQALFRQLREAAQEKAARGSRPATRSGGEPQFARPAVSPGLDRELGTASGKLPEGTVTFLFTDLESSVKLWEQHPEAMPHALARHDALLRQAIENQGGHVFKTVGDAVHAVFGVPAEAVAAALEAQRALLTEPWEETGPLRVRMALHTGVPQLREGDYFGAVLNRVARLKEAGHGGQVLLSAATQELVRDHLPEGVCLHDLGEHRLRDLARPERVYQLVHTGMSAEFPPLRGLDARPNNLPVQPTPLIGREEEVVTLQQMLGRAEVRLVTLTGPGGTGKTRLALRVAADLLDRFRDGVYFVDLAPIHAPALVAATIAQTLGVRDTGEGSLLESLKRHLREKQHLLVLDNFEQVLAAAQTVAELLGAAPRLKVLVTSRAVLRLRGEQEFVVLPLAGPDPRRLPTVEALSQYAAVALFVQRAASARPEFKLAHENAPAVAEICHRLDGLPLALELAAARIKLFSPQALLARMEKRLPLMSGGPRDLPARQQTLRSAIAWSYDLLTQAEQTLFQRLSVFVGGCTLEAAEAVGNAEGDLEISVLEGVDSLLDQSMLRQVDADAVGSGEMRLVMLETIREFGLEQLQASGEAGAIRRQHAHFFLHLAEEEVPETRGPLWYRWLDRMEAEHDNLRAALDGAVAAGEIETALRLAGALQHFWGILGHHSEGRQRLTELLARTEGDRTAFRARALDSLITLCSAPGDLELTQSLSTESLSIWRELGDNSGIASALLSLALVVSAQGDTVEARVLYEECLTLRRGLPNTTELCFTLHLFGQFCREQGESAEARRYFTEGLSIARRTEDVLMIAWSLYNLGESARLEGDRDAAWSLYTESLPHMRASRHLAGLAYLLASLGLLAQERGDPRGGGAHFRESLSLLHQIGWASEYAAAFRALAVVAAAQGDSLRAARLLGAVASLPPAVSRTAFRHIPSEPEAMLRATRGGLSEEAYATAWAEGQAMSLDAAIRFALEDNVSSEGANEREPDISCY